MKNKFIFLLLAGTFTFSNAEIHHKCINCHGTHGERSALGKSKPILGMDKDQILNDLKLYKEGKLNRYGFGGLMKAQMHEVDEKDFESIAEKISKEELIKRGD